MELQTIIVPYDSGHEKVRMGAGPGMLFDTAVEPLLRARRLAIYRTAVTAKQDFRAEIATAFELNRGVASHVAAAAEARRFPLVLSGNCNAAIGTVSGLAMRPLGIVWLDAHGDFNTPETTESGMFDGMGLATIAGLSWTKLAASIPGFRAIAGDNIVHLGSRDLEGEELRNLQTAGVQIVSTEQYDRSDSDAAAALQRLRERTANVYLHLDVDVIARSELCANEFSPPGGLPVSEVERLLRTIADMFDVEAFGIASYDPAKDPEGAGRRVTERLLAVVMHGLTDR